MPKTGTIELPEADLLQDPRRAEYLSDQDIETIRSGLRLLAERLGKCKPWNLPTAVMFTETSARPFAYAFKPVLEKLYVAKGRPSPLLMFILTHTHPNLVYEILKPDFEWEKSWEIAVRRYKERTERKLEACERRLSENDFSGREPDESVEGCRARLEKQVAEHRSWLEGLPVKRDGHRRASVSMEKRFGQVAASLMARGRKPYFLIVDEHVYGAGTLRMLEAAYRHVKRDVPKLRVDYFTFIDGRVDACEHREGGLRRRLGRRFLAATHGCKSFCYMEANGVKPRVVGVAKLLDRDSVFRAPQRDLAKMRFLRQLLRQIGEEAAANL